MEELIRELEPFATERGMLAEMSSTERDAAPLSALALNSTVRSKPATQATFHPQPSAAEPVTRPRTPWLVAAGIVILGLAWLVFGSYARPSGAFDVSRQATAVQRVLSSAR
jgi:hypothetical protein